MDAFSLTRRLPTRRGVSAPRAARLIDSLGSEDFGQTFFGVVHEMTGAHYLSAFAFLGHTRPRILVAESIGRKPSSREIAEVYCDRYWNFDLANDVLSCRAADGKDDWCVRTSAMEISQDDYKRQCYTAARLTNRICVSHHGRDENIRLNFYGSIEKSLSDVDLGNILDWADIFISVLRKNASIADAAPMRGGSYAASLRRLPAKLPRREVEICDAILQGVSSEGIALRLRISINTVRTYRKRAYARLGISSQNELMRLVSRPPAGRLAS